MIFFQALYATVMNSWDEFWKECQGELTDEDKARLYAYEGLI